MSDLVQEIQELKKARKAVILAHNYTLPEVQDVADFTGDSLELSRKAAQCQAPVIVFCGVRFMAETAKILSPDSVVLHPEPTAGCPMADMAPVEEVKKYRVEHPDTLLVAYVNTTAATKTAVDICCTSGNAERVISSIPKDKKIMFLPDADLGANVSKTLNRPMELWEGFCPTHYRIHPDQIDQARQAHPGAAERDHQWANELLGDLLTGGDIPDRPGLVAAVEGDIQKNPQSVTGLGGDLHSASILSMEPFAFSMVS